MQVPWAESLTSTSHISSSWGLTYYPKQLIDGSFGSGVAGQGWTQPQAMWGPTCVPGWAWRTLRILSWILQPGMLQKGQASLCSSTTLWSHTAGLTPQGREEMGWCLAGHEPCSISPPAHRLWTIWLAFTVKISQALSVPQLTALLSAFTY